MSREEAIETLSDLRAEYSIFDSDEATRYHALSWAIQALGRECKWFEVCPTAEVTAE